LPHAHVACENGPNNVQKVGACDKLRAADINLGLSSMHTWNQISLRPTPSCYLLLRDDSWNININNGRWYHFMALAAAIPIRSLYVFELLSVSCSFQRESPGTRGDKDARLPAELLALCNILTHLSIVCWPFIISNLFRIFPK
jgi:hypothetical protein